MADPSLNNPVIIQATRLDASILPRNVFSKSYLLYVIAQGTDVGSIAGKANEAGKGAYDAQVKNDEQDVELADHEARIQQLRIDVDNHEIRIAGAGLAGMLGASTPWGAGIGAGIGLLGSLF